MSIAFVSSSEIPPHDVVPVMNPDADALRREAEEMLAWLDDPLNAAVNLLFRRSGDDPVLRKYGLAKRMLELALHPGPGNHNIRVNIGEEIGTLRACLSQVSDPEPAVAVQNEGRLGAIVRYVRKASLSFFS